MASIQNRYDFVLLFDVENGNPNGDPDAGNMPRIDPETGHGIVTDVCLKRKVRNYVDLTKAGEPACNIYVREKAVLNTVHAQAYQALGLEPGKAKADGVAAARDWMCANFYDVRSFGAVMSTNVSCGQVRGPVQFAFAKSIEPVVPRDIAVTRMAVTTEKEAEDQKGDNRTMGRKFIIPYALYRVHGFISAPLAEKTGFSDADLTLFWEALASLFEHDRSAARGEMASRKLFVFKHNNRLGNAPAHQLFERVQINRATDCEGPARAFGHYSVSVNRESLPDGVELLELL